MSSTTPYEEFGLLHENASEWDLPLDRIPPAARISTEVAPGQELTAIRSGAEPPEVVLLHGGGQNAHTWDTFVLSLGRPALAVDLPGHGHSSWRADRDYWRAR